MIIDNGIDVNLSPESVLKEGLTHKIATKWYSNSGSLFPGLIERFRPANLTKWIDFKIAIRADLEAYEKPCYRFPVFSDKILTFNLDLSSDLFAYIEDIYDGGSGRLLKDYP